MRGSPGLLGLLRAPPPAPHPVRPVYLCANVGSWGLLPAALPAPISTTLSLALSVYLCATVESQGLLVVRLPAPLVPHSASLGPAMATRVLSAPVPDSAPPTRLDECLFFISLVSDFLAVGFSVSSGCESRRSVSTYAAILVLSRCLFFCSPLKTPPPSQYTVCDHMKAVPMLNPKVAPACKNKTKHNTFPLCLVWLQR